MGVLRAIFEAGEDVVVDDQGELSATDTCRPARRLPFPLLRHFWLLTDRLLSSTVPFRI